MITAPDPAALLELSARVCCVGILAQAIELVSLHPELRDGGLLGWHGALPATFSVRQVRQRLQGYPVNLLVLIWRVLAASVLMAWPALGSWPGALLWITLFFSQVYFNRGARLFFANSDHMNLICFAGIAVAALPEASVLVRRCAFGFIAVESCLGYAASGFEKFRSAQWRSGLRLAYVLQDGSHHVPGLGPYVAARPRLSRSLSWSVVALELSFPVCVVMPDPFFWTVIAAGLLFHGMIAVLMALPGFFWAFAATYPALYFLHAWIAAFAR